LDRAIVWTGAQPRSVDFLQSERNTMVGLAKVVEALAGTSTFVAGLPCAPTSPASMQVSVGPGQIYSLQNVDGTPYSSLAADTTHQVMKQGLLMDAVALSCPAPGTAGQSINYLVQAAFQEVDGGATVLPYFNSAAPTAPFNGPNGTNTANYTLRQDQCVITVKAGVPAATGSQTTPAPDAGNVGLYAVTVANGATTIIGGNIAVLPTAPFLTTIGALQAGQRTRLTANTTFYVATTGSDANNGLSAATPWLTLQHAYNAIQASYDCNGFAPTISVANGTYTAGLAALGPIVGYPFVQVTGNVGTPASCFVNVTNGNCFSAAYGAVLFVNGFKVAATGTSPNGQGVATGTEGALNYGNMEFGACGVAHASSTGNGVLTANANYTISGSAPAHFSANSLLNCSGVTITLTGTPAFSSAFAVAVGIAEVYAPGLTFVGSATGPRYAATLNAVINTNGGGASYFPGNSVGSVATGGLYA
jgi:hypothetical protein